ncbi:TomO hydrophobic C-terminal domain-containing protein [Wolbachia endosymbiont (group B) of Episyrphus balteatus]|uniref:TomO hydrophobic C-terminal domain-containing protein n=1 Tax=Wolbachia endosymbiont (group B) of Episyrphus balteatus TaxID=2954009 RepID=UPI00222694EE|nr:hypothetical protein [Wolbachia endosymbiont (group B) of Episyrphus balteatus]
MLNDIDDNKKVDVLFKEISGLDIEKVWREQKEFILLKRIYIASTTYGEGRSACIQGTWTQIINSIDEISSEILEQYDHYLEEEQKLEAQKDVITEENIEPFMEDLANRLIQYVKDNPELKEVLQDHLSYFKHIDVDHPEKVTFEQQKILAEINKYFSVSIKNVLPNYNRNIPNRDEYRIIIDGLLKVAVMQNFAIAVQEQSNAEDNSNNYATIRESNTDEEPLVPERLYSETSVVATDQTNGIQNNNQQPSNLNNDAPRSKEKNKLPTVCAFTLAIAGIVSGIAIAVYSGMLAVGIAVGVFCLIAAEIIYYCNKPSKLLENSNAEVIVNQITVE